MPSRVIRGEINSSASLSRVSLEADLCFRALIVAVDDFGRADARPALLKATLFPVRDSVSPDDIMRWIAELESEGCVQLYEVAGHPYLSLPSWEKHRGKQRRAGVSRYPDPPSPASPEILGNPRMPEELHAGVGVGVGVGEGVVPENPSRDSGDRKRRAPPSATRAPEEFSPEEWARIWRLLGDRLPWLLEHEEFADDLPAHCRKSWVRGRVQACLDWGANATGAKATKRDWPLAAVNWIDRDDEREWQRVGRPRPPPGEFKTVLSVYRAAKEPQQLESL